MFAVRVVWPTAGEDGFNCLPLVCMSHGTCFLFLLKKLKREALLHIRQTLYVFSDLSGLRLDATGQSTHLPFADCAQGGILAML